MAGKYWKVLDDGAKIPCADCGELAEWKDVYLTETPNGNRAVLHKDCICEWWLNQATFMGMYDK